MKNKTNWKDIQQEIQDNKAKCLKELNDEIARFSRKVNRTYKIKNPVYTDWLLLHGSLLMKFILEIDRAILHMGCSEADLTLINEFMLIANLLKTITQEKIKELQLEDQKNKKN